MCVVALGSVGYCVEFIQPAHTATLCACWASCDGVRRGVSSQWTGFVNLIAARRLTGTR